MPHTPTERSFDINFLRCGGKTKRRRKSHELCCGLLPSRVEWCIHLSFSFPLGNQTNLKAHVLFFLTDDNLNLQIDPLLSSALERKRANYSVVFASSDQGLTTVWQCSIETHANFSDFLHFQAGTSDFKLVVVKHCVWGTFKGNTHYSARFKQVHILCLSKIKRPKL